MKKLGLFVITFVLVCFFSASINKAQASVTFFGVEFPTSITEAKRFFSMNNKTEKGSEDASSSDVEEDEGQDGSSNNPIQNWIKRLKGTKLEDGKLKIPSNEDINNEEESKKEGKVVYSFEIDGKKIIRKSNYDGMLAVIKITPTQINRYLQSLKGKGYMGYKLESAHVELFDDGANVYTELEDGKAINLVLGLNKDGHKIEVKSIENAGSKNFSKLELGVIKGLIKSAPSKIFGYFPEFKNKFEFVTITPNYIDIWVR